MTHTPLHPTKIDDAIEVEETRPAATTRKRGRAKWPWIAGGLLAVVAIGSGAYAMTRGDDKPAATPTVAADAAPAGPSATEGTFAFTITGSKCGVASVGPTDLLQKATGQFCLVDVAVRNVGKEADLLDSGAQHAVDSQGRQYPVSDRAAVFLNDQTPTLLEEIKPGVTVRGVLPFDVPVGAKLTSVVLHESVTSTGVSVPLS
jgi:hypothetical protein